MFRANFTAWSTSGFSMVKGFFSLSAQSIDNNNNNNNNHNNNEENWPEKMEKILKTSAFADDEAEAGPEAIKWMAEPLTDKETREANADTMRVR